jgi:hypothetical protein
LEKSLVWFVIMFLTSSNASVNNLNGMLVWQLDFDARIIPDCPKFPVWQRLIINKIRYTYSSRSAHHVRLIIPPCTIGREVLFQTIVIQYTYICVCYPSSFIDNNVNWDILASWYFGGFLSKCGCLILVCLLFGAFQKMIFWCFSNG